MSRGDRFTLTHRVHAWGQTVNNHVNWLLVAQVAIYVLLGIVLIQVLSPSDRVLPGVRFGGTGYGGQSMSQLTNGIQDQFDQSSVQVVAGDSTSTLKLSSLGAAIDASQLAERANHYDLWQRLIPLSIFFVGDTVTEWRPTFDNNRLAEQADTLAQQMSSQAQSGSITINDQNEIIVEDAKDAVTVEAAAIRSAISQAAFRVGSETTVKATAISTKPAVSNETIQGVKTKLLAMSGVNITITNSLTKQSVTPDPSDILAWLNIEDNSTVAFDDAAIRSYLVKAAGSSVVAAGTTKVVTMDGHETSRTPGKNGRTVDSDPLIVTLKQALESQTAVSATMNFKDALPTVSYDHHYSHSQQGLQAYINQVTSSGTIQISVKQLTGNGWSASARASESVVSASTYKLFVSLILMKKIEAGEIQWSDAIQGTDVTECLRKTIVVSANNCAEDWLKQWGRKETNSSLYGLGFSSATTFTASDASHTSAADLQKLLIGLHNRSLFSADNANHLIGLMKQQIYRQGIPKGSAGVVADKVGFLWGYLNDAAIVYHPQGTYVLVIMTNNQSWAKIAEITRTIESLMY